mmetsp:Transcript_31314/g.81812  ORF Transcript_31314/g.81812 Transcript_31314/m.81812 type:complete len:80 (+) Transcript_31314:668-907(+)
MASLYHRLIQLLTIMPALLALPLLLFLLEGSHFDLERRPCQHTFSHLMLVLLSLNFSLYSPPGFAVAHGTRLTFARLLL